MITCYTWTTPNGYKIPIALEELGLPYDLQLIDLTKGEQKTPAFLECSPNGKIPVLSEDGTTIFESGAILIYLAEKAGKLMERKYDTLEWLMFQMASVGPMFGQFNHFKKFAPEKIEYGIKRYGDEAERLCGVMDTQLGKEAYLAGEYSIADIATWPWVRSYRSAAESDLSKWPNLKRWYEAIEKRPAVVEALKKVDTAAEAKKAAPQVCPA